MYPNQLYTNVFPLYFNPENTNQTDYSNAGNMLNNFDDYNENIHLNSKSNWEYKKPKVIACKYGDKCRFNFINVCKFFH